MSKRLIIGGLSAGLAALVAAAVAWVATQPDTFEVKRSAEVGAPVAVVFDQVNVMKARKAWYPWDQLDPDMERIYGEIEAGVGATYQWSGNDQVGKGRQEILRSVENEEIVDSLEFIEPFAATNTARFTFEDLGDRTRVTWSMSGGGDFSTKVMNAFMDMDSLVGADFEQGLAALDTVAKAEAERRAQAAAAQAAAVAADEGEGDEAGLPEE